MIQRFRVLAVDVGDVERRTDDRSGPEVAVAERDRVGGGMLAGSSSLALLAERPGDSPTGPDTK